MGIRSVLGEFEKRYRLFGEDFRIAFYGKVGNPDNWVQQERELLRGVTSLQLDVEELSEKIVEALCGIGLSSLATPFISPLILGLIRGLIVPDVDTNPLVSTHALGALGESLQWEAGHGHSAVVSPDYLPFDGGSGTGFSFDGDTQYWTSGAGTFMVWDPSPDLGKLEFGLGNKVLPYELEKHGRQSVLFDLSAGTHSIIPIVENGKNIGFEMFRSGVNPRELSFLLKIHGKRGTGLADKKLFAAEKNPDGTVDIQIRVLSGQDVQGNPEKVVEFYILGDGSSSLLASRELHPGVVDNKGGAAKNRMLSQLVVDGERVLLVTPAFPKSAPDNYIVWTDENGDVFAGKRFKDAELKLVDGAWVEAISPAEQAARDLLIEHGFDVELVDFREEEGVIVGYDRETGELAFRDGKFDIRWAVEHMDTSDLMPTEIKPIKGLGGPEDALYYDSYFRPRGLQMLELIYGSLEEVDKLRAETGELVGVRSLILLDPQRLVWGDVFGSYNKAEDTFHEQYLAYQDAEGGIHYFEVLEMDDDLFMDLLYERGRLAYEE